MTDEEEEWKKKPNLNIPLSVIVSICSARTDCSIFLPCWNTVHFYSLPLRSLTPPLPFPIIAIWLFPFHCQSGPHCCSTDSLHSAEPSGHFTPQGVWSSIMEKKTLHCTCVVTGFVFNWKCEDKQRKCASKIGRLLSEWNSGGTTSHFVSSNWEYYFLLRGHGACKIRCCLLFCIFWWSLSPV